MRYDIKEIQNTERRFNEHNKFAILPVRPIFEPEPVGVPQPLELLLDDLAEKWPRPTVQLRLQHASDVQVDVVDVSLVSPLQVIKQLKGGERNL